MDKKELKKTVEENLQFAKKCYEEDKEFCTMFFVSTTKAKQKQTIAAMAIDESIWKDRFKLLFDLGLRMRILEMKGEVDSIDGIFMLSETWMSRNDKNLDADKIIAPSKDPNKEEALVSGGLNRKGEGVVSIYVIKKSFDLVDNKVKVDLVPEGEDVTEMESPLLKNFWKGVQMLELFEDTLPADLKSHMMSMETEYLFELLISQLNKVRDYV